MNKAVLLFVAFITVNALAQMPALEFKGIPLGITLQEAATNYKKLQGEIVVSSNGDGAVSVEISDTVAGIRIKDIVLVFTQFNEAIRPTNYTGSIVDVSPELRQKIDGCIFHLVRVEFDANEFATVKAALVEKYGAATTDKVKIMENGFGAKNESEALVWVLAGGRIKLDEHFRIKDRSRLVWVLDAPWPRKNPSAAAKDL